MMAKKLLINVQDHHTYGEYQRYFSHLLKKGKLRRYSLKEKNKLDPNRQYWKIKDEKGKTYYYEVPRYIKASSTKSAYSFNRVMHRRPFRAAIAIVIAVAALSITSSFVMKKVFQSSFPDVPPNPTDVILLQEKLKEFREWEKEFPEEDATKKFSINDLATMAMAATLFDETKPTETGYMRRPLLAIGHGTSDTNAIIMAVHVDISNAFIFQNGNALEEAIFYSKMSLGPQEGRRDYFIKKEGLEDGEVHSNHAIANSSTDANWSDKFDRNYSNETSYIEVAGKTPDNPFLYTIDETTILKSSTATKTNDGYIIEMDLHHTKGVARYVKRMKYLSGKDSSNFSKVHLTFITDHDLHLITSNVDEHYLVQQVLDTTGTMATTFYYEDVPEIPSKTVPFDYSKYSV